jgi:hypothetical protein
MNAADITAARRLIDQFEGRALGRHNSSTFRPNPTLPAKTVQFRVTVSGAEKCLASLRTLSSRFETLKQELEEMGKFIPFGPVAEAASIPLTTFDPESK